MTQRDALQHLALKVLTPGVAYMYMYSRLAISIDRELALVMSVCTSSRMGSIGSRMDVLRNITKHKLENIFLQSTIDVSGLWPNYKITCHCCILTCLVHHEIVTMKQ